MRSRRLAMFLLGTLLAGCAGSTDELTVSAASSMREVIPRILDHARINAAGSDTLAVQIVEGAPIDLFISAGPAETDRLRARGLVEKPEPIATNSLTIVVPPGNPARVHDVADLSRAGLRLVLAQPSVPVGGYARTALARLGMTSAVGNVVSNESSAAGVLAKVRLGEADAGIVYLTDARSAGNAVGTVAIPPFAQPQIVYTAAVVAGTPHPAAAREALRTLTRPAARRVFASAGFGPPPG